MEYIRHQVQALELDALRRRITEKMAYGFTPYGIAMHGHTATVLEERLAEMMPTFTRDPYNYNPKQIYGLPVFIDYAIPRNRAELVSEEEAKRRGYMGECEKHLH